MPLPLRLLVSTFSRSHRNVFAIFFSSAAAARLKSHDFMAGFLTARCGLSSSEAAHASKHLAALKSVVRPERVLAFFRQIGFGDNEIKNLIAAYPRCLAADVDRTLRPKVDALSSIGFSSADISGIVTAFPSALCKCKDLIPKIEFLRTHLPDKADFLKVIRRNNNLLCCNFAERLAPNVALLQERGVPARDIKRALLHETWALTWRADKFRVLVARTERLGFAPLSRMYVHALRVLSWRSEVSCRGLVSMMARFGLSEDDFYAAFRSFPLFIGCKEDVLLAKLKFLVEEANVEAGSIVSNPSLLCHSLEKRLSPRLKVHRLLSEQGLLHTKCSLATFFRISDKRFLDEFVVPSLEQVPQLLELYPALDTASCSSKDHVGA